MSLMRTLAKVAVGVAVAKGASSMMRGGQGGGGGLGGALAQMAGGGGGAGGLAGALSGLAGGGAGGGGLAGALGALTGGGAQQSGGLNNALGALLGGSAQGGAVGAGGLGGLLDSLGGAQQAGGLQGMLGGLAGAAGGGAAAGGLAGMLGGLQNTMANAQPAAQDGFGAVLNSQFEETSEPAMAPSADQEAAAGLMLRAMIQATKADGAMDDAEQAKLIEQLGGDVDAEEAAFVQAEMQRPMDIEGLVADTPNGMGPQVYAMSVLGIDLDSQAEAQYLHQLAQSFGLDTAAVNDIHSQLGVPSLYA